MNNCTYCEALQVIINSQAKEIQDLRGILNETAIKLHMHTIHSGDSSIGYCSDCETVKRARKVLDFDAFKLEAVK